MTQKSCWITSKQLEKTNKQTLPIITLKTKKNTHLTIWCRFEVWRHAHLSKLLSISNT
jgi:abortive infection bacteriophage resistance protein